MKEKMGQKETEKVIPIVAIVVVAVVILGGFSMMSMMSGYWGGWYGRGGMMGPGMMAWGGMGYGWWNRLGGLVFLVILAFGLYLILSGSRARQTRGALEILKERYAKGEITEEQFKKMREDLE